MHLRQRDRQAKTQQVPHAPDVAGAALSPSPGCSHPCSTPDSAQATAMWQACDQRASRLHPSWRLSRKRWACPTPAIQASHFECSVRVGAGIRLFPPLRNFLIGSILVGRVVKLCWQYWIKGNGHCVAFKIFVLTLGLARMDCGAVAKNPCHCVMGPSKHI